MTKLRVVEPTTDLTRVSEGIAQLEIMLNDVIKVSNRIKLQSSAYAWLRINVAYG